eukprot:NODE_2455_length_931_cov_398.764840.p1 GENE.NODE_2455_length_931_cov_398.764840~~NODE_2455_length_931_cov_398.764840.p1  ORF type:complete len:285 (+),score=88.50 NODE_2455_length_931_cov_398.764840:3-857(+)
MGQRLLWVDISLGYVYTYDYEAKENVRMAFNQPIGTVVPYTKDSIVVALAKGPVVVHATTGVLQRYLGNPEAGLPFHRFNDGKCGPCGRFFVGSVDSVHFTRTGSLWSVDVMGQWTKHLSVYISNGLVWSRDATQFFYVDTVALTIDRFSYNCKDGTIAFQSHLVELSEEEVSAGSGKFDGMAIDAEDNLWVCMWEGGHVRHYDSRTGKLLGAHKIPGAWKVTSCAFGGQDLDQLFITTASCWCTQAQLDSEAFSNAGALFRLDLSSTPIRGVPSVAFGQGVAP